MMRQLLMERWISTKNHPLFLFIKILTAGVLFLSSRSTPYLCMLVLLGVLAINMTTSQMEYLLPLEEQDRKRRRLALSVYLSFGWFIVLLLHNFAHSLFGGNPLYTERLSDLNLYAIYILLSGIDMGVSLMAEKGVKRGVLYRTWNIFSQVIGLWYWVMIFDLLALDSFFLKQSGLALLHPDTCIFLPYLAIMLKGISIGLDYHFMNLKEFRL